MGCQSRTVSGETVCIYPLFAGSLEVEPRGFEPPTSAVQSQIHNVVVVRYCSEILANWHIHPFALSSLFAIVCAGWCTTGVNKLLCNIRALAHLQLRQGCPAGL